MKNLIFLFMSFPVLIKAQQTYVPDNSFESYLEIHDANGNVVPLGDPNAMGNGVFNDDSVTTANISAVTHLDISGGAGTAIGVFDLTGIEDFTALTYLSCYYNNIFSLDLSNNAFLDTLICFSNQLNSLDLSNNTRLVNLNCHDNQLSCLNLKNGNNTNMVLLATLNPSLSCIEVDDAAWSTANWTNIDSQTSFSTNCNYPAGCFSTNITENTNSIFIYPNPTNNLITIDIEGNNKPFNVELYDFTGRLLKTTNNTTISLKNHPKGIYLLNVAYGDKVEQIKVIKE